MTRPATSCGITIAAPAKPLLSTAPHFRETPLAFILPTFNLEATIHTWTQDAWPWPIRGETICQLRAPDMSVCSVFSGSGQVLTGMVLLCPKGTDIRDFYTAPGTHPDQIEVPKGSGRVYAVTYSDDIAKGFDNEHRFAVLRKVLVWPTVMP